MTQGTGKPSSTNYLPYILIAAGVFILIGNLDPGIGGLFELVGSLL